MWSNIYPETIKVFLIMSRDFESSPKFDLIYMYYQSSFKIQVIIKPEKNNIKHHCCNISKTLKN